jgi:hypothetical protein
MSWTQAREGVGLLSLTLAYSSLPSEALINSLISLISLHNWVDVLHDVNDDQGVSVCGGVTPYIHSTAQAELGSSSRIGSCF